MPAKGQIGIRSVKNNQKRCYGPLHQGEWISVTKFLPIKRKRLKDSYYESRCRECVQARRGYNHEYSGRVPVKTAWPIFYELVSRLGVMETERRTGIQRTVILRVRRKQGYYIKGKTFAKAFKVLVEVRANDEVRHRNDIRTGANLRGRVERNPKLNSDYYNRHNDKESEWKRAKTKKKGLALT